MPTTSQKKYLAQVYNIGPDYAQDIYEMLLNLEFEFSEIEKLSEDAYLWYKERKFRPSTGERLTGYAPPVPIYNV